MENRRVSFSLNFPFFLISSSQKRKTKSIQRTKTTSEIAKRGKYIFYAHHNQRYCIIMTSETDYHQFELKDQKRPIRPKLLKLTDDGRGRKKGKFKVIQMKAHNSGTAFLLFFVSIFTCFFEQHIHYCDSIFRSPKCPYSKTLLRSNVIDSLQPVH